jgi:hypothetical protein
MKNAIVLFLKSRGVKVCEDEMVEITKLVKDVMIKISFDRIPQSAFDELKQFNIRESIKSRAACRVN